MCQELTEFTKTRFITTPITFTPNTGIPVGEGACKAVRLRVNALGHNLAAAFQGFQAAVYYGDARSQENELIFAATRDGANKLLFYQSEWTPLIYCQNLEEVFIRSGYAGANADPAQVQVMILS